MIFEEFLKYEDVEELLKDSYANYVIQTCLDNSSKASQQDLLFPVAYFEDNLVQ